MMPVSFAHIGTRPLGSECARFMEGGRRFAEDIGLSRLPPFPDAGTVFARLQQGPAALDILELLSLFGLDTPAWNSVEGQRVVRHCLASVRDDPSLRRCTELRALLADHERWPGPGPLLAQLRQQLAGLVRGRQWPNPSQHELMLAVFERNVVQVAQLAIRAIESVPRLFRQAGLPPGLPIIAEAVPHWFRSWIDLPANGRRPLASLIHEYFEQQGTVEQQQAIARRILSHPGFPQTVEGLRPKVATHNEITLWLSSWSRNSLFRQGFTDLQRRLLSCWIGSGNYAQFENIIRGIGSCLDPDEEKKTINRYLFWRNYQERIEEGWLLIPDEWTEWYPESSRLRNRIRLDGYEHPVGAFKLGEYYFFQTFVPGGGQDLLVSGEVARIQGLMDRGFIDDYELRSLEFSLIMDHSHLWQIDAAWLLQKHFGISPASPRIVYGESHSGTPLQADFVRKSQEQDFREKRRIALSSWAVGARRRHGADRLRERALALTLHGLD